MGVVPAQHGAYGVGALAVGLFGPQGVLVHGVEDAPVHRLQAVPHVGQGPLDDDGHGVVQKGLLHLLGQVHIDDAAALLFLLGNVVFMVHRSNLSFLRLYVPVGLLGVLDDEIPAGFYLVAHEHGEHLVGLGGVLHLHPAHSAGGGVHGGLP